MSKLPVYEIKTGNRSFDAWVLFDQAHRALARLRAQQVRRLGMKPGQTSVLFVLVNKGGTSTSNELSDLLGREVHTITGFINRMERAGLVQRVKEAPDRRFTKIVITEKGRYAWKLLHRPNAAANIFTYFSGDDMEALIRCLKTIRRESLRAINAGADVREVRTRMSMEGK